MDVIARTASTTVARLLERDDFAKRNGRAAAHQRARAVLPADAGVRLGGHPSDVELGGTEQKLQPDSSAGPFRSCTARPPDRADAAHPAGPGWRPADEQEPRKLPSGVSDRPAEVYGKLMSLPDAVMPISGPWSQTATERESREIEHDLGLEPGALDRSTAGATGRRG